MNLECAAAFTLFPNKLYRMVSDPVCPSLSWGENGDHILLCARDFEDELLRDTPERWKYQLKTTSTTSFIRQLHAYGFRKVLDDCDSPLNRGPTGTRRYFHPYFHRERPDLLMFMKRSLRSYSGKKQAVNVTTSMPDNLAHTTPSRHSSMTSDFDDRRDPHSSPCSKRRRKARPKRHPCFSGNRQAYVGRKSNGLANEFDWAPAPPSATDAFNSRGEHISPKPHIKEERAEEPDLKSYFSTVTAAAVKAVAARRENQQSPSLGPKQHASNGQRQEVSMTAVGRFRGEPQNPVVSHPVAPMVVAPPAEPLDLSGSNDKMPAPAAGPAVPEMKSFPFADNACGVFNNVPAHLAGQMKFPPPPPKFPTMQQMPSKAFVMPQQIQGMPIQNGLSPTAPNHPTRPPTQGGGFQNPQHLVPRSSLRFPLPQYSVLQPAYIAWPTRRVFCVKTNSWMLPKPTIIPLPCRGQPPLANGPSPGTRRSRSHSDQSVEPPPPPTVVPSSEGRMTRSGGRIGSASSATKV